MIRCRWLVAATAVAMLVVTGCGSDGSSGEDAARGSDVAPSELDGNTSQPAEESSPVRLADVSAELGFTQVQAVVRSVEDCLFSDSQWLAEGDKDNGCQPERFSGGVAIGDFDGDGLDDVFFTHLDGPDVLWRNNGDGTFEDVTEESGIGAFSTRSNGAGWADLTGNGLLDLVVTTMAEDRFYAFINQGDGTFTEEAVSRGLAIPGGEERRGGFSVAFGDYDNDGFVDVHLTEWVLPQLQQPGDVPHARLLRNKGDGSPGFFEDVSKEAGVTPGLDVVDDLGIHAVTPPVFTFASAFVDLDGDGFQDLVVAGDFGTSQLFWNNGDGTFSEGAKAAGFGGTGTDMGLAILDVDGDGLLDVFTTAVDGRSSSCGGRPCPDFYGGNRLYLNNGDRTFTEVRDRYGVGAGHWGWGAAAVDLANDGWPDIAMANGVDLVFDNESRPFFTGFRDTPNNLWLNRSGERFVDVASSAGLDVTRPATGLAVADLFGDGRPSLLFVHPGSTPTVWRNTTDTGNAWLRIRVEGAGSGKGTNAEALGAVVRVTARQGETSRVAQVGANSHYLGQSERTVHVGLGDPRTLEGGTVAEVEVFFPVTGRTVVLRDVEPNQVVTVTEPLS